MPASAEPIPEALGGTASAFEGAGRPDGAMPGQNSGVKLLVLICGNRPLSSVVSARLLGHRTAFVLILYCLIYRREAPEDWVRRIQSIP